MVAAALAEVDEAEPRTALEALPEAWVFAPFPETEGRPVRGGRQELVWRDPDIFLRWDFLPKVLAHIPITAAMTDAARRPAFVDFCVALLNWTNERLNPSWREADGDRRERRRSTELIEWRRRFLWFLAHVALEMEPDDAGRRVLDPILAHADHEIAASMIYPFLDGLVAAGVVDAPSIDPTALQYIEACRDRILHDHAWLRARRRDGEIYGFDLPYIVRVLFFIDVTHSDAAVRFANGDWRDIGQVLPVIDPFIRAVGDIPAVTGASLTLCELAINHYPRKKFVEQIEGILALQRGTLIGWRGTTIPARIAALVHAFGEKSLLEPSLATAMLRILDRLVDMGDRRSAALQTSEVFKEVRFWDV